jgi:hypothetical protein
MATIPVVFDPTGQPKSGTLGVLVPEAAIEQIDAGRLQRSLSALAEQVSSLFQDIKNVGDFKLKEVQVAVEITAEGGVALIANARAGAKGAITLTFAME